MPYPLLNDSRLALADLLGIPILEVAQMRLYRRLTFIARRARIEKVFYPVFPPDEHPAEVIAWLAERSSEGPDQPSSGGSPTQ